MKNLKLITVFGLLLLSVVSCQTGPHNPNPWAHIYDSPKPKATPVPALPALAWEAGHSERTAWSTELRAQVKAKLGTFSKATDVTKYCTKYKTISDDQKVEVIATMFVAVARYESDYDPKSVLKADVDGQDSIGLYQLSYTDYLACNATKARQNLTDPIINIQCALPLSALLISQNGVIASGGASPASSRKGNARYWSVYWPTSHYSDIVKTTHLLKYCN